MKEKWSVHNSSCSRAAGKTNMGEAMLFPFSSFHISSFFMTLDTFPEPVTKPLFKCPLNPLSLSSTSR